MCLICAIFKGRFLYIEDSDQTDESTSYKNVNRMLRARSVRKNVGVIEKEREDHLKIEKIIPDQEENKKIFVSDLEIRANFFKLAPADKMITETEFTSLVLKHVNRSGQEPSTRDVTFDRVRQILIQMKEENLDVMFNSLLYKFHLNQEMKTQLGLYFLNTSNTRD